MDVMEITAANGIVRIHVSAILPIMPTSHSLGPSTARLKNTTAPTWQWVVVTGRSRIVDHQSANVVWSERDDKRLWTEIYVIISYGIDL